MKRLTDEYNEKKSTSDGSTIEDVNNETERTEKITSELQTKKAEEIAASKRSAETYRQSMADSMKSANQIQQERLKIEEKREEKLDEERQEKVEMFRSMSFYFRTKAESVKKSMDDK